MPGPGRKVTEEQVQVDMASDAHRNVRDAASLAHSVADFSESFTRADNSEWRRIANALSTLEEDIKKLLKE